jgi:hypothetical protein
MNHRGLAGKRFVAKRDLPGANRLFEDTEMGGRTGACSGKASNGSDYYYLIAVHIAIM